MAAKAMPNPSARSADRWERALADAGMPAELAPIPRPHLGEGARARFESDGSEVSAALDVPPPVPRSKRPGRPYPGDREAEMEQARDLLRNGKLKGVEREAWIWFCAELPEREIAQRLGRSQFWVRTWLLGPLKERAGMHPGWFPRYRRPSLAYRPRRRRVRA